METTVQILLPTQWEEMCCLRCSYSLPNIGCQSLRIAMKDIPERGLR